MLDSLGMASKGMKNSGKIDSPRMLDGPIADAYAEALNAAEPIFVPIRTVADDRGWSIMNQLQGILSETGQINYSVMYPSVIKAWHRHKKQTDFWLCVSGHIKVGICREVDNHFWAMVIGQMHLGVVIIPPQLWHGAATVGDTSASLLYYVTETYDPHDPDEQRMPHDAIAEFSWQVEHR